jgi:hypothetical protein
MSGVLFRGFVWLFRTFEGTVPDLFRWCLSDRSRIPARMITLQAGDEQGWASTWAVVRTFVTVGKRAQIEAAHTCDEGTIGCWYPNGKLPLATQFRLVSDGPKVVCARADPPVRPASSISSLTWPSVEGAAPGVAQMRGAAPDNAMAAVAPRSAHGGGACAGGRRARLVRPSTEQGPYSRGRGRGDSMSGTYR